MEKGIAPGFFKNLLNAITNYNGQTGSVTVPSTVYIGLLTGLPSGYDSNGYFTGHTEVPSEVSSEDTGYKRLSLKSKGLGDDFYFKDSAVIDTETDPGKVTMGNYAPIQFPVSLGAWSSAQSPIIGFALFDSLTGGNCIAAGSLTSSVNVSAADQTVFFGAEDISLTIAPETSASAST